MIVEVLLAGLALPLFPLLGAGGDSAGALQAMLDADPVVRLPAAEFNLTRSLTIRHDGATLLCTPGTVLRADGFTGPLLIARGLANVTVSGCRFDGALAGANGEALLVFDRLRGLDFSHNTVQNTVEGMYAVLVAGVTSGRIADNRLQEIRGPGISVAEGSAEIEILRNIVDATVSTNGALSGAAIEVKGRAGSLSGIDRIAIRRNSVRVSTGFCFEAGQFGGTGLITGIRIVDGNHCQVISLPGADQTCGSRIRPKTCGGYSFSGASDSEIVGNSYDATGQAVDIAAVELVHCRRCVASTNVLVGDTSPTSSGSSGISANCSGCTISGNQVTHLGPVYANALIDLHTTPGLLRLADNTITGNTLILPGGGRGIKGVYVNCNHSGGAVTGTLIAGNRILGPADSGQGVALAANAAECDLAATEVLANAMSNLLTGLLTFRASAITWGFNRLDSVQTPILEGGGSTFLK